MKRNRNIFHFKYRYAKTNINTAEGRMNIIKSINFKACKSIKSAIMKDESKMILHHKVSVNENIVNMGIEIMRSNIVLSIGIS